MNRLIIIGNGFDLAHGIKSSSKHLILHYLSNVWKNLASGSYNDRFIEIKRASVYYKNNASYYSDENALEIFKKIIKNNSNNENDAFMVIKSTLFEAIFNKILSITWSDFETEYFNELYNIVELSNKRKDKESSFNRISLESLKNKSLLKLNTDLDHIEELLINYLKSVEEKFIANSTIDSLYSTYFYELLTAHESNSILPNEAPKNVYFLNFNYTNTLEKYSIRDRIIHIHGTLDNNPIFGFGDDTSEKYIELENEYNNEFLKKIKSFKYLNNGNYRDLISFVNSAEFQVHIYGHSCGVSDRTLFKRLFENENCKSIKIFYYNEKDFEEKKYEISRHFKNKNDFLGKVIPYSFLRRMPQPCEQTK